VEEFLNQLDKPTLIAILAGIAGIVTAFGGVLLAVRTVRSNERKAATAEIDGLTEQIAKERQLHINCEMALHEANLLLATNGIKPYGPDRYRSKDT
jgi:hypothetical protein